MHHTAFRTSKHTLIAFFGPAILHTLLRRVHFVHICFPQPPFATRRVFEYCLIAHTRTPLRVNKLPRTCKVVSCNKNGRFVPTPHERRDTYSPRPEFSSFNRFPDNPSKKRHSPIRILCSFHSIFPASFHRTVPRRIVRGFFQICSWPLDIDILRTYHLPPATVRRRFRWRTGQGRYSIGFFRPACWCFFHRHFWAPFSHISDSTSTIF